MRFSMSADNTAETCKREISPFGFGAYRVGRRDPVHRKALLEALASGVSLIDTSTNYMDGESELLIGEVLKSEVAAGRLKREDVTVVTKTGYIQGRNVEVAAERQREGRPFQDTVKVAEGCWHSVAPDFIDDQLERSLSRLQLESVDTLLLHNPEYYLKATRDPEAYYSLIRRAFEYLETQVEAGKIGCYGISSNTFPEAEDASAFTSLDRVWRIANEISPKHHFSVVQFPMNLFESGAVLERNNRGQCVVDYARERGIRTLINRPLNSFNGVRMLRLADFPVHGSSSRLLEEASRAVGTLIEMEQTLPQSLLRVMGDGRWGQTLQDHFHRFGDISTWREIERSQIRPSFGALSREFDRSDADSMEVWERYQGAMGESLKRIDAYYEALAGEQSSRIRERLDELCPELRTSSTLSQKVLRLYRSVSGVDCVLVGMRRPEYVRDVLSSGAPISNEEARRVFAEIAR